MNQQQALNYIREQLNTKPLTYQLGFLQGFLAKQMSLRMEIASEFRDQARATQKPPGSKSR
jgi:hypothetical protein